PTGVRKLVQVGRRVYDFHAETPGPYGHDTPDGGALRNKFFDSVKITLDGGAGAAAGPGAADNRPADPGRFAGAAAPTAAAKVPPLWAVAFLPQRNEVPLLGTRMSNGRLAGELRRYSLLGFLPKNTYYLPLP